MSAVCVVPCRSGILILDGKYNVWAKMEHKSKILMCFTLNQSEKHFRSNSRFWISQETKQCSRDCFVESICLTFLAVAKFHASLTTVQRTPSGDAGDAGHLHQPGDSAALDQVHRAVAAEPRGHCRVAVRVVATLVRCYRYIFS